MSLLQSYLFAANLREESVSIFPLPLDSRQHSNSPYPSLLQGRAEQALLPSCTSLMLPSRLCCLCSGVSVSCYAELKTGLPSGQWTHMWLHGSQVKAIIISYDLPAVLLVVQPSLWLVLHHCKGTLLTHTALHATSSLTL